MSKIHNFDFFSKNNFIFGLRGANLAGIDTPHANFQKSKIFKKFPKRGTKNVKNQKFYFFRKINAKFGVPMVILVGIDTKLEFL